MVEAPTGNWLLQSLRYMEQGVLAEPLIAAAAGKAVAPEQLRLAVVTPLAVLHCPTRRAPAAYPLWYEVAEEFGPVGARTDYAINGGSAAPIDAPEDILAESTEPGLSDSFLKLRADGVWTLNLRTAFKSIVDGTSHTYFVGEKAMDVLHYETGKDVGDRSPIAGLTDHVGASNSYVRFAARTPAMDIENNCRACHNFGSAHPSGMNMSLADGSVQTLTYDMELRVHRAMATIAGEEVVP